MGHNKTNRKGGGKRGTKTKKRKFVSLNCSPENQPSPSSSSPSYTCYSAADLATLKSIWNTRHPDRPIRSTQSKEIWEKLKAYYANVCHKESCWVRQMTKNTKLEKELLDAFAPVSPKEWEKNPNEWLSSIDILQVMGQYEKKYRHFDFLGPSPIDYDTPQVQGQCVWNELCKFSLSQHLKKGHTKIGVIFNLDPHYKGGSHWVSLFIHVPQQSIFFFDSTGEKAPPQIMKFVATVTNQGRKLVPPKRFLFDQNHPVEHQYGNTECGMYSIFFITHMLEDKINGHYLKTHVLKDKYMEKFRKIYYNSHL